MKLNDIFLIVRKCECVCEWLFVTQGGPVMNWQPIQGVTSPSPKTTGTDSSIPGEVVMAEKDNIMQLFSVSFCALCFIANQNAAVKMERPTYN